MEFYPPDSPYDPSATHPRQNAKGSPSLSPETLAMIYFRRDSR